MERFTRSFKFPFTQNAFVKSMVRGNLTKPLFEHKKTNHHPNIELIGKGIKNIFFTFFHFYQSL